MSFSSDSSRKPWLGERVVVTRARHQAAKIVEAFEDAGARVELLPLIDVAPPVDPRPLIRAAERVGDYDWVVFTSANAVEAFLDRLRDRWPQGVRTAAVGPATSLALEVYGLAPGVVAVRSDAEGLVEEMAPHLREGDNVLVPRADDARPALVEGLEALGAQVEAVDAYSKRLPAEAEDRGRELFEGREIGWVTFTSPRIVRHFAELFGEAWKERRTEVRALSIGPVTTRELHRQGVESVWEASRPSPEEMVRARPLEGSEGGKH